MRIWILADRFTYELACAYRRGVSIFCVAVSGRAHQRPGPAAGAVRADLQDDGRDDHSSHAAGGRVRQAATRLQQHQPRGPDRPPQGQSLAGAHRVSHVCAYASREVTSEAWIHVVSGTRTRTVFGLLVLQTSRLLTRR